MKNLEWNSETNDLLIDRGLNCICQLCDCGRWHKHAGCKVPNPTIASAFSDGNDTHNLQTDYQARFPAYEDTLPPKPIYPEEEKKNPSPPKMDLNTVKQLSYQNFNIEKREPYKLKGEMEDFMTGEFNDQTNYKDSFVGYAAKQTKSARPPTVFKGNGSKFSSITGYRNDFQKKEKVSQETFKERPTRTYNLLYPDNMTLPKQSLKNSVHDGRQGEKTKSCQIAKSNVDFGLHGEFDHTTTHGVYFKQFDIPQRVIPVKNSDQGLRDGKFMAISQNQADYRYNEKDATTARAKKCHEHPSLIQLSMDIPHDFATVSSMSYHKWQPQERQLNACKPITTYTPPKVKFDGVSSSHRDFVNYGVTPRTEKYHPPEFRKSSAKISGESSYRTFFPNHGKVERKFYGEYQTPNIQLPPKGSKFDGTSIMRHDYKPFIQEKRQPFKPSYSEGLVDKMSGKFQEATEYKEKFIPKPNKECKFLKYMAEMQAGNIAGPKEVQVN